MAAEERKSSGRQNSHQQEEEFVTSVENGKKFT